MNRWLGYVPVGVGSIRSSYITIPVHMGRVVLPTSGSPFSSYYLARAFHLSKFQQKLSRSKHDGCVVVINADCIFQYH